MKNLASSIYVKLLIVLLGALPLAMVVSELLTPSLVSLGAPQLTKEVALDLEGKKLDTVAVQDVANHYGLDWLRVNGKTAKGQVKVSVGMDAAPAVKLGTRISDYRQCKYLEVADHVQDLDLQYGLRIRTLSSVFSSADIWTERIMLPQMLLIGVQMLITFVVLLEIALMMPLRRIITTAERFKTVTAGVLSDLKSRWAAGEMVSAATKLADVFPGGAVPTPTPGNSVAAAGDQDMFSKSVDEHFAERMKETLMKSATLRKASSALLHSLGDESPAGTTIGFIARVKAPDSFHVVSSLLPPEDIARKIEEHQTQVSVIMLKDLKAATRLLASDLFPDVSKDPVIAVPLCEADDEKLVLVLTVKNDTLAGKLERLAKKVQFECGLLLRMMLLLEQEASVHHTDPLTGLPNARRVEELSREMKESKGSGNFSCFVYEGDHFMFYNTSYGRKVGDALIKRLGEVLRAKLDTLSKDSKLYRLSACRFLVVYQGDRMHQVADSLRKAVAEEGSWPKIPAWTASVGIANFPGDCKTLSDCVIGAQACLEFIKTLCEEDRLMQASTLPKSFLMRALGDDSPVFDPFQIIQNCIWQHGVLTAKDSLGRNFVMSVKDGLMEKARLDAFNADAAVVEFLTTFEEGTSEFQEFSPASREMVKRMGMETDVSASLGEMFLRATAARQKLAYAKTIVSRMDSYLFPLPQTGDIWIKIVDSEPAPTQEEVLVMQAIMEIATGNLRFPDVAQKLNFLPTYLIWNGVSVLLNRKILKFSNFKVAGDRAVM